MNVQFNPNSNIIKLCMMGIGMKDSGKPEEAETHFQKAWSEAANDFERFIAAYFVAQSQKNESDKVKWLETSLQFALKIEDASTRSALSTLYTCIAKSYEELSDPVKAKMNDELSDLHKGSPMDEGPFYHGTKADLKVGDLLTAGGDSNYKQELKMNHIYFTSRINGAGLAAELAKGDGRSRVYIVEPTGTFEDDPNVTDKKFPGNLTCSYRSQEPLKIVGEETDWKKQTPDEINKWREKVDRNKGEIIN